MGMTIGASIMDFSDALSSSTRMDAVTSTFGYSVHGMAQPFLARGQLFDGSQVLSSPSPAMVLSSEEAIREARQLFSECLGERMVDLDDSVHKSRLPSDLDNITIEKDKGEVGRHIRDFYANSGCSEAFRLLGYTVYLSTNNLLSDERLDKVVAWLLRSERFWALGYFVNIKSPTTETHSRTANRPRCGCERCMQAIILQLLIFHPSTPTCHESG